MIIGNNKRGTINADEKIRKLEKEYKILVGDDKNSKKYRELENEKDRLIEEETRVRSGYANPEGYRKALHKMKLAEKFNIPIVTFIDTPGAYPGIGAEERGIAQAIAVNLKEMSRLKVPIISVIIGEGGSGGALGIGVGDRLAMLQHSYYSVITPEGCAAILWRDKKYAGEAAEALKLTSQDLYELNLIDYIIKEPLGGAHRNPYETFRNVRQYLNKTLRQLKKIKIEKLIGARHKKLRNIGRDYVKNNKPGS